MSSSKDRRWPSPAMVVALIALLVALGGSAYAAKKLSGSKLKKQSVAGKKLKEDTLTGAQIDESQLGQVPSAASADRAISSDRAGSAGRADTATNASRLGNVRASGYVRRFWAVYDMDTDSIVRSSGGVSLGTGGGPGVEGVVFPRNVSNCAWVASLNPETSPNDKGQITTEIGGSSAALRRQVTVRTYPPDFSGFGDARSFSLVVTC
jgi:hypothetical protein